MRRASFAVVVVLPEPCRPTIMMATGGTALRSMVWPSEPSVAISSSWTILTTIWPGVTDLTTVAPTACSRTRSVKLLTTSSETSASSSARRTSRIAASTSASDSDPRPVSRSSIPPSFSDRLSNNAVVLLLPLRAIYRSIHHCHHPPCAQLRTGAGDPVFQSSSFEPRSCGVLDTPPSRGMTANCLGGIRQNDRPNTFAPEGASRCRALASGLVGRAAGRKERLSEKSAG